MLFKATYSCSLKCGRRIHSCWFAGFHGSKSPLPRRDDGLAALFFRERPCQYCAIGLGAGALGTAARGVAGLDHRTGRLGCLPGLHCWKVGHLISATAEAHKQGWFRFGGLTFVVAIAQMNACLILLPVWITAIYFVVAIIGFAGWRSDWGRRITLAASVYIAAFSIVGNDFNRYWGLMIAPLFCFGAVHAPRAIADLWRAAKMPLALPRKHQATALPQ